MSLKIDTSKTLSDEERQYLVDRERWDELAEAEGYESAEDAKADYPGGEGPTMRHASVGAGPSLADHQAVAVGGESQGAEGDLNAMTKPELQAEAEQRGLSKSGTMAELIARIEEHDDEDDFDSE